MNDTLNGKAYRLKRTDGEATVITVSAGGRETDCAVFGKGRKPLVILPGLSVKKVTDSAGAVAEAFGAFREEYTGYLFDIGDGISEGYLLSDAASDTAAAMKSLEISGAYVFGASQGGMMALLIASGYPELVKKLALGSVLIRQNDVFNENIRRLTELSRTGDVHGLAEEMTGRIYSEKTLAAYREVLLAGFTGVTREELRRFEIMAAACAAFCGEAALGGVKCPAYVLGAENDRMLLPEGSYEAAEKLGCPLYMYGEGYGHAVYDEAPDYRGRLLSFFAE